jgi:hypothetical protein
VDSNFPPYEALTGFAAHFRQLYSNSERGSFYAVMKILRQLSQDGSVDEAKRLEMLKVWSDAIGALRSKGTLKLAEEKLGVVRPGGPVGLRPDALIRMFINGEHLHWQEKHASSLSARAPMPRFQANLRYKYHESVAPIAYLFICFAFFVNDLLRRSITRRTPNESAEDASAAFS